MTKRLTAKYEAAAAVEAAAAAELREQLTSNTAALRERGKVISLLQGELDRKERELQELRKAQGIKKQDLRNADMIQVRPNERVCEKSCSFWDISTRRGIHSGGGGGKGACACAVRCAVRRALPPSSYSLSPQPCLRASKWSCLAAAAGAPRVGAVWLGVWARPPALHSPWREPGVGWCVGPCLNVRVCFPPSSGPTQ